MKLILFFNKLKLLGLLTIVFILLGCQQTNETILGFGLATAPVTLDPRFATDATSTRINRLLYWALTDFDENLRPVPSLARWEQLSPTCYRFYLGEQGRTFHDNSRLTASDVKATYDFVLASDNASPHRGSLAVIAQIKVQNPDTIDFILSKPDTLFPGRLVVGILPAKLIQENHPFNKEPVGSGPFRFLAWPQPSRLSLQRRNDNQTIEFLEIKNPVVRVLKLVRNEIDIIQSDLSPELITWLTQRPEVIVTKGEGSNFTYLGVNLQDPLIKQLKIRQAIAYAINREDIIHYVLGDAARPASSLLPPTHWAGHPALSAYPYDPDKARTLLAEVGFNAEHPLSLTYKTSNNPFRVRIASVIQHQLAAVNINVDIKSYDWGTFYGDIKTGRFQMFSLSWVGIKMPDIFRYVFHSSAVPPSGANRGRFLDEKVDQLIEQAEQATSLEAQAALYRELQAYVFYELPYIPLWYEDHVLATSQRVRGYTLAIDGNYDGLKQVTW